MSDGEEYRFEIVAISVPANDEEGQAQFPEIPQKEMACFWLCGDCSVLATIVLDPMQGLQLVPFGSSHGAEARDFSLTSQQMLSW
jgi:hypothetical protein